MDTAREDIDFQPGSASSNFSESSNACPPHTTPNLTARRRGYIKSWNNISDVSCPTIKTIDIPCSHWQNQRCPRQRLQLPLSILNSFVCDLDCKMHLLNSIM